jgi:ribonuclease Z
MAKVILLGTASAIPDQEHENTHLVIDGDEGAVLIDCVGTPLVRLGLVGIHVNAIQDLIVTHFHPDHVCAVPLLLMNMWLLGRKQPLNIHGLQDCLDRLEKMMDLFEWRRWPNFFPVHFQTLPLQENYLVIDRDDFQVISTPVQHLIPTIGLKIESKTGGKTVVYSCDTEPCDEVVQLAKGAEILIHEATGKGEGHSSAEEAAQVAKQAGAKQLLLIHYVCNPSQTEQLVYRAKREFGGHVSLARDLMEINLENR